MKKVLVVASSEANKRIFISGLYNPPHKIIAVVYTLYLYMFIFSSPPYYIKYLRK